MPDHPPGPSAGAASADCGDRIRPDLIPRPQIHHERGPASRPAIPAAQPPLEVDEAGVARLATPKPRGRDFTLMPTYPAAYPHHMPGAQVLEPKRIPGRQTAIHVRVLF